MKDISVYRHDEFEKAGNGQYIHRRGTTFINGHYVSDLEFITEAEYNSIIKARKAVEDVLRSAYDYYDGYTAGKILMNHADISGEEMITKAMAMKPVIEKMVVSLSDKEALEVPELFPEWTGIETYKTSDRVYFFGLLYKCLQDHTSQFDWQPDITPSLWVRVDNPDEEYPEWRQPTGATDAYMDGDKVTYDGKHYISIADDNVWKPTDFGWVLVEE